MQRYRKKHVERFLTYKDAREEFDRWHLVERKRIRRRPEGHYDLIEYERIPEARTVERDS